MKSEYRILSSCLKESHPVRGAWIEILRLISIYYLQVCRTPSGVRGLKFDFFHCLCLLFCRTPSGVRGLKWQSQHTVRACRRRTPSGVRGLKFIDALLGSKTLQSHPVRGAWIEIPAELLVLLQNQGRTPSGVRGLKSVDIAALGDYSRSHPVRGAWIEILSASAHELMHDVAPRQGCVD